MRRVLIFGDDFNRMKVLAYALAAVELAPVVATGRGEALVHAASGEVDVVVVDVEPHSARANLRGLFADLMPSLPVVEVVRPISFPALLQRLRTAPRRRTRMFATP